MKKIFLSLFFSLIFSAAFGQLSQFRMIGSGSWTTVNDSTFSSTVTIQSDLTSNGFLPTGITDSMFVFTQTGQRYRISSATSLTFSSADLVIIERGGNWGTPVGQFMIYEDNERTAVPAIPFGATGATAKLQEAIVSYNSIYILSSNELEDSLAAVRADFPVGGATTFTGLTDTPSSYSGQANKMILVNSGATGLIFADTAGLGGGGGATVLNSDLGRLEQISVKVPAQGLTANESVTNYNFATVNAQKYYYSATEPYGTGGEYGGWLSNGTSNDSITVSAPFWVVIGDSQAEGHVNSHGRLHPAGVATFDANTIDVSGQLSYHLRENTKYRWYNHGIGGQTTAQVLARWNRDVLAQIDDVGDSRGSKTLERKPEGVVVIAGINDFYSGLDVSDTKANLEAMAASAAANGLYCVMLNVPGDEINSPLQSAQVDSVNTWLAEGALNPYGTVIVDYNSWWRNPDYDDNFHGNDLLADDIHPTAVGYDSLADYIFREAKLPVLDSVIIYTRISPTGLPGYSRPTSIRIDGTNTYAITDSVMSIALDANQHMSWDSVSIAILASANVTGTTYTGISHIEWRSSNTYSGSDLVTRRTGFFPGKASSKWDGSTNISPANSAKVSIGTTTQYDANTVLTIKGLGTTNVNDIAITDYTGVLKGVMRTGTGVLKFGINKTSPAYPLHVEGTVSFDNAGTYFSSTGSNVSLYGGNPVFAFQSTTASPYRQSSFSYDAGNRVFALTPRTAPNGQNYKFVLQDTLTGFPFVFDLRTRRLGLGGTQNPRAEIEMKGNIILGGSSDNTTASKLIFHDRRATENYISFRSQDTSSDTDYSLPQGGASTFGKFLQNNTGDSLSWDYIAAENIAISDTESVFDSTTVEGALEELDEMSRNKFFYISGTNTLPLAKGNTAIIIDGTTGPFTVTLTVTNLRVGDEVKVFCNGGSVTLDSSSGAFIRPSVGTNEATIPIDAEGYILVWDGSNFYQVN